MKVLTSQYGMGGLHVPAPVYLSGYLAILPSHNKVVTVLKYFSSQTVTWSLSLRPFHMLAILLINPFHPHTHPGYLWLAAFHWSFRLNSDITFSQKTTRTPFCLERSLSRCAPMCLPLSKHFLNDTQLVYCSLSS